MAVDVQVSSSGHLPDEPEVTADPVTGEAIRAIAPIVGVSREQVRRDTNVSPEPDPELAADPITGEVIEDAVIVEEPRKITGLDGKTYTHPQPSAEARERAEAERAAQQEWAAYRDLYSEIARSVSTLAGHATRAPVGNPTPGLPSARTARPL